MALGVGDVVRISARFRQASADEQVNTWDVEITNAGSGGNTGFSEDAEEFMNVVYLPAVGLLSDTLDPYQLDFYQRNGLEVIPSTSWPTANAPTASGDVLPLQDALVLVFRSERRGSRLRKFLPSTVEGFNEAGSPAAIAIATGDDVIEAALAHFTGDNGWEFNLVLWPETATGTIPLINGFTSPQWGTQRRRRRGRGS